MPFRCMSLNLGNTFFWEMCSSNMYDCCKWFPDLLSLNVEGSVSVLKYSAVVERISNCVYRAICFNIEYLQLNSWGTKRSYSLGFCICQIAPYVKLCMLIKMWLQFVWSPKRGFPATVACQRWFWQARTAPEPAHFFWWVQILYILDLQWKQNLIYI